MRRILLVLTTLVLVAAACSSGTDQATAGKSATDAGSGGGVSAEPSVDATSGDVGSGDARSVEEGPTVDLSLQQIGTLGREIIKTGRVRTVVDDVPAAVNEVSVAAEARAGFVFGRTVSLDGERPSAEVVVKVPAASFDQLMNDLSAIGDVQAQESTAEDVTDQIVDIESRLTSARASVDRVRGFLDKATNVDELTRVEAELTRRESDLEALQGRLAVLEDQTSLSTISVSLATDPTDMVDPGDDDKTGFAAGFDAGRDAFSSAARAVLALVGFSLPFVPVLALAGGFVWLMSRVRRRLAARSVVGAEA